MEDIYKDNETAQQDEDYLRKSRDVPLFLQMHHFYAKVHEDVMKKFPIDVLLSMEIQPERQTKQQIVRSYEPFSIFL